MVHAPAPVRAATVPQLLDATAGTSADRLAIRDGEVELTYSQLRDEALTCAAAFVESGVRPGDRVAIWAFNSVEWVVAYFGLIYAGATLVPVNTRFRGREAAEILARGRVHTLCTVTDFLGLDYVDMLRSSNVDLPDLQQIVVLRGKAPAGAITWPAFRSRASAESVAAARARAEAVGPDDIADVLFTSGTTGTPKGVMMTHSRSLHVAFDYVDQTGLGSDDRYLMVNPYFHMFGLKAGILAATAVGAAMFPVSSFDVDDVLTRVQRDRISAMPGPPTLFQGILDHPSREQFDLSSLRVAVTGATDIPIEVMERIVAALPSISILNGYGLTEAGTVSGTVVGDDIESVVSSSGRQRPGVEIRFVDEDGAQQAPGTPGEIWIRSPAVMLGYLDDPASTSAVLTADGWLRTGDIGTFDEHGMLHIVGRLKDMFIVGGFNAYPAEIENMLLRHPAVAQVAVIGVPDARLGEVGMAFVVPVPGAECSPSAIIAWARQEMANYKAPRVVRIVDQLPINATGKVLKTELREWAAQVDFSSN